MAALRSAEALFSLLGISSGTASVLCSARKCRFWLSYRNLEMVCTVTVGFERSSGVRSMGAAVIAAADASSWAGMVGLRHPVSRNVFLYMIK